MLDARDERARPEPLPRPPVRGRPITEEIQ